MPKKIVRTLFLTGLCFLGWLAVTRDFHPVSLAGAALLSAAAAFFAAPLFFEENPLDVARLFYRPDLLALLFATLLIQGYIASAELIARMLSGRYRPGMVRVRTRLRSRLGRVLLANSVTLVPGTLSLWLQDRHLYVHWFDVKSDHSIRAGDQIKRPVESLLERAFG